MGLSSNVEKMVQYRKGQKESQSSSYKAGSQEDPYESLSDNVRKMADKRAAQVSKNAKKNSVSLQKDKRTYHVFGSEETSRNRNQLKISEEARQDALKRLRQEQTQRNTLLPEQIELNQKRRELTDFKRQDREEAEKYVQDLKNQGMYMQPIKESSSYLPFTKKWKQAQEREKEDVYQEALKRFQEDPEARQNVETGQAMKHGLSDQPYVGNEPRYHLRSDNTYYMTQEERDLYNYILSTGGKKDAIAYLDRMKEELDNRAAVEWKKAVQNIGQQMPGRAVAFDAFMSTEAAPTGFLYALAQKGLGNETDTDSPYFAGSYLEDSVREGIEENKLPLVSKGASDFLIDTGLSMTQNMARLPLGSAGLAVAAGGAATGAYLDAKERGASENQALLSGIAQGGAEAFFEKFSLENLKALKAAPSKTAREFLKNILKQSATEGSEEMATELTNAMSDWAIMKEMSQIADEYGQYKAAGESDATAKWKTLGGLAQRIGLAGLGGALSGGVMGGGADALGTWSSGKNSNVENYQDYADAIETDESAFESEEQYKAAQEVRDMALELAKKQQDGETISNMEKGYFENATDELARAAAPDATIEPIGQENDETDISPEETEKTDNVAVSEPQGMETEQESGLEKEENITEQTSAEELKMWSEIYGKNGQQAFEQGYEQGSDINSYYRGFARYYNAGRYNMDISQADKSAASIFLSPEQAREAYRAGAMDRNLEIGYDPETGRMKNMVKGDQKNGGLAYAAESATQAQKKVADVLGKRTGLKFELVDEVESPAATASYSPGVVRISTNAENFNAAVSHELTHFIQDYSPDMYQLYQDQVVKAITEAEGVDIENLIDSTISQYGAAGQELTRAQAMDEIVADATERYLNDPEFIDRILKEDRTLAERILDFIEDMIESLKELMKAGKSSRKAAQALEQNLEYWERGGTYWRQGLLEAGDRYKSGWEKSSESDGKYQLEQPEQVLEEQIRKNYQSVRSMDSVIDLEGNEFEGKRGVKTLTDAVTEYYSSIGNLVHNDVVGDIILNKRSVKDDMAHGYNDIKAIAFKAVPDILKKGKVLQYSKTWKGRNYDSAAIGAKFTVKNGKFAGEYYGLAMVNVSEENNKMYLHEVQAIKIEDEPFKTSSFPQSGSRSGTSSSIYSIFNRLQDVNGENKESHGNLRFQLEEVDNYQSQITELLHENDDLKEANKLLKKQFELTSKEEMRQEDIKKVSNQFLKKYSSSLKSETLERNLTNFYEYIRSSDRIDPNEVSSVAADIARSILKNSKQKDTALTEQYKDLRRQIKNTKITISEQDRKDLASIGGYNDFRRKYFGRMNLGNEGISVDSLYEELSDQYPELFDISITHPADRLMQIGNVLDLTQSQVMNPYHANLDEMSYIVGQELIQSYWNVRQPMPTFADKRAAELNKVKRQYQEKLRNFKNSTVTQYEAVLAEKDRELKRTKDIHKRELLAQQEKFNKKMKDRRDSLRSQNAKKSIIKEVTTMQKWLLSPTDAKHVPQQTRAVVADFLNNIDFSSKGDGIETQRDRAWDEASREFEKIIKAGGIITDDDGNNHYVDLDPDLAARFEELNKKVKGIPKIEELDAYSLEELQKVVISMKKALMEVNEMKSNARYRRASLLAEEVFRETSAIKDKENYRGLLGTSGKLMDYDMLDPQTMFGKIGPAFKSTYDSLRSGLDKKTIRLKEAEDYFNRSIDESGISRGELRKWTGINAPTYTFDLTGGKIEFTIPQIMSLYELDKRGQAKKHIYDKIGGIKADGRKMGISWDNKSVHLPQNKKQYRPIRVSRDDVKKVTDVLTPEQKKLADALQHFMGNEVSQWGNEVTMEMYGYEKFTAKEYFPIVTDKNSVSRKEGEDDKNNATIRNLGITKDTNKHANNPIVIEDIFDVFTRQVDQMSSYNAYVLPLSDLHKVMNYKDMRGFNGSNIKEELERTFGKEGIDYIDKLIQDINGSINPDNSISNIFLSNMKAASVAGNLRVAVQQPTAIARAAAEINPKYLVQGVAMPGKQWDIITAYAPIAQWKDWGFYRMQTSRQMKDVLVGSDSAKQRFVNKTMILAELGDKIAWKRLWNACELECIDNHPELERGTEEFYKVVGNRFSEIVDKTQVVDSVLHRTQIMRNSDGLTKMATSFMGEPLKTYNMLYRAAYDVKRKKKGSQKELAASLAAFAANGFLTALSASIVDGLRDDDRDKTYTQKYLEHFAKNMKDNFNLLNNIPFVKDAVSIAGGYTPARTDLSGIQDIYYAYKKIEGLKNGKSQYTPQYVFLNTVQALSKATGVPIKSITRDAMAIIDTAVNAAGGEQDYIWLKNTYDIGKSDNGRMYAEMILQAEEQGNIGLSNRIREDMLNAGMTEEQISNKINNIVNETIREEVDIIGAAREYDSSDAGKKQAFAEEIDKYISLKMKAGWNEEKCLDQVKKMLTEEYKPQYQAAETQKEREQIISKCRSFYYNGDSLFKDYKFSTNWKKKE